VVTPVSSKPGFRIRVVLVILALLSMVGGWVEIPESIGILWPALPESLHHLTWFTDAMHTALPAPRLSQATVESELTLQTIAGAVSLAGILLALVLALWYRRRPQGVADDPAHPSRGHFIRRLWAAGWGFDAFYDTVIVQPFVRLAQSSRDDVADALSSGTVWLSQRAHDRLRRTQTGRVRWYAASLAAGAVLIVACVVFL
jgi:NADH-quinone oxidoreductase subunit L